MPPAHRWRVLQELNMKLDEDEEQVVWAAMDTDHSGSISRSEFMDFWVRSEEEEDTGKWDLEDVNRLRRNIQRYAAKHAHAT